jgi:hypothetical protein
MFLPFALSIISRLLSIVQLQVCIMSEKQHSSDEEKRPVKGSTGVIDSQLGDVEDHEVFKKTSDGVDFRTVSWPRATIIFLKGKSICPSILILLLTVIQSSLQLVFSVSPLPCISWELWVERFLSLVGDS